MVKINKFDSFRFIVLFNQISILMFLLSLFYICAAIGSLLGFEGIFWHISDIHLNVSFNLGNNRWYGDYKNDASFPLVHSAIKAMKTIYHNPLFIIWNGDNAYHRIANRSNFLVSLKNVSSEIRFYFPNANILPTLGNHDVNPSSLFNANSTWCEELLIFWKDFVNSSENETKRFLKGCFYSRTIKSGNDTVKIIVLNSMLWYRPNKLVKDERDPLGQFSWLMNELEEGAMKKQRVFVVSHIPPGASEFSPKKFRFFHSKFNKRFLEILQNYSNIIDAGFFGHQHVDAFKIVYDTQGKPKIPLFLSPSVSPLHLKGLGSINPSIRLFFWNSSLSNCKYQQYHTTIPNELNNTKNNTLNWILEYDSKTLYSGLSAEDLDNFSLDLSKDNSIYFERFFTYHLSGRSHDSGASNNSTIRCQIVCGLRNIDYTNLDKCLVKCSDESSTFWMIIGIVIASFLLALAGFVIGSVILLRRKTFNGNSSYKFTIEQL